MPKHLIHNKRDLCKRGAYEGSVCKEDMYDHVHVRLHACIDIETQKWIIKKKKKQKGNQMFWIDTDGSFPHRHARSHLFHFFFFLTLSAQVIFVIIVSTLQLSSFVKLNWNTPATRELQNERIYIRVGGAPSQHQLKRFLQEDAEAQVGWRGSICSASPFYLRL